MMVNQPRRCGLAAVALGLALLGGCLPSGPSPVPLASVPSVGAGGSPLNAPQVADVKIAMARSLERRGEVEQAAAAYDEALQLDPSRADACLRLAALSDEQGKFTESAKLYRKALAARPGSPDTFCNMGYSLYLQHRLAEAEMNLRQAIALAPDHPRAHNNLGLVLAHAGRPEEALAEFRKAGCNPAQAQENLAFILVLERRLPEARRHFELALEIDPSSKPARKGLREVDALLAKTEPNPPAPPGPPGTGHSPAAAGPGAEPDLTAAGDARAPSGGE